MTPSKKLGDKEPMFPEVIKDLHTMDNELNRLSGKINQYSKMA
jgi:hypothetical protein